MNQEWKEKWVAALRSGEYAQTRGRLHTKDGYCCLGVLEDLVAKEKGDEWHLSKSGRCFLIGAEENSDVLRRSTMELVKLRDVNPMISSEETFPSLPRRSTLASANDSGYNFEQIADIIESQL